MYFIYLDFLKTTEYNNIEKQITESTQNAIEYTPSKIAL